MEMSTFFSQELRKVDRKSVEDLNSSANTTDIHRYSATQNMHVSSTQGIIS